MSLQDLVNLALDERRDANYKRARADAALAAVIGEAERLRMTGVSVRELDSDQRIGSIRLDGANLPASPVITNAGELASWLAELFPELVTAAITVPVGRLEEVLELLSMAGLRGEAEASVTLRDLGKTLSWLGEHCKVQGDPEIPHAWNVLHVDDEGHPTLVPGVTARRPQPTWKVIVAPELQADARAVAQSEVEEIVRQSRERDAADSRDAEGYTVGPRPRWYPDADDAAALEQGMKDGDPVAAALHATFVQGGFSTPAIEAERMAHDRRRVANLAADTGDDKIDDGLLDDPTTPARRDDDGAGRAALERWTPPDPKPLDDAIENLRDAESSEYSTLTRAELTQLCRDRTLLVSGTEAELVDRLVVADRNLSRPGWTARL